MKTENNPNLLDIIIVNYNSTEHLLQCLKSLHESLDGISARVIVEDNASRDGVGRVQTMFPQVVLSKNIYNMGFAKAVNQGLAESGAPYVVILNPDTYVVEGFFDSVIRYMEDNTDVGIVGPRILNLDGSVQGSARSFPTPLTALFGRSTLLTKWFPNNRFTSRNVLTTRTDGVTPIPVDWVSGACMVVRRKAIEDVGPMDERFFIYWEDADWCQRMWDFGWKVVYFPQSHVIHYVGVSSSQLLVRSAIEFHKSSYRLFEKHSKPSARLTKPLVFGGLATRLLFVLSSEGLRRWALRHKAHLTPEEVLLARRLDKRIKVLQIIARLNIGGPAIHLAFLVHGLDHSRFESTLVTGQVSPEEGDMSYLFDGFREKVVMIPELQRELNLVKDVMSFCRVLKILRQEKPDIVHTHTAKAGSIGRLAVVVYSFICRRKVSVLHTFHGHVFRGYFGKLKSLFFIWTERWLAKVTDVIVVVSDSQKEELCSEYHIGPTSKFKTIKLGFDLQPFFSAESQKGVFRRSLGIDRNTILVGIVGRLVPIKNHKMFLRSARIFLDQNPDIPTKFLLIGDGELRNDLAAFCDEQGLSDHVQFCGWRRDLPKVYADLDILCMTSINEGTPVSIIEAMASSVPVISTDAGGVRDLLGMLTRLPPRARPPAKPAWHSPAAQQIAEGQSGVSQDGFQVLERGMLCRQDDPEGFASGLQYVIKNRRIWEEISNSARSFVSRVYSREQILSDIESIYLDLVKPDQVRSTVGLDAPRLADASKVAPFRPKSDMVSLSRP
ncbi:MAG: glycosyltransferase [Deltaproteobacteria bacterium]|nr:glycosyltransferase [Deltaproteobacteria bacterium]